MKTAWNKEVLNRIKKIHHQSQYYNQLVGKDHQDRLLDLMRKHIDEIEYLLSQKDKHGLVETGDLLILCLELLLEHKASPEVMLVKCMKRYEKKLSGLISECESKNN